MACLTGEDWALLLSTGTVEIEGRMPWSSNATFLVNLRAGELVGRGIYKPGAGERPLWDYPSGLYRREVAAYELSRALGLDVVPETVLRADGPVGEGSVQRFVDADFSEHYFTMIERAELRPALRKIAAFDLLANSGDRKGGHLLLEPPGAVLAIDNGLCCHAEPKLRTVMWDFVGERLPEELLAGCRRLLEDLPEVFFELLDDDECEALLLRAERLLQRPEFPRPRGDHRAYPWPPV